MKCFHGVSQLLYESQDNKGHKAERLEKRFRVFDQWHGIKSSAKRRYKTALMVNISF